MGYVKFTIAVKSEEAPIFEECLNVVKKALNEKETSPAIKKAIELFPEYLQKAELYDQIAKILLAFETLRKYQQGELVHAEKNKRLDL